MQPPSQTSDTSVSTLSFDLIEQVRLGAWRWLHSLDFDPASKTWGVADREYWAWKVKDFPNGTWQGGIAGFLDATPWLGLRDEQLTKIVRAVVEGCKNIQRLNGSFEEAYPLESSYCVTALVLFNLLYAWECYPQYFESETCATLRKVITEGLRFVEKVTETHGVIANHLAAGVMAVTLARRFLEQNPVEQEIPEFLRLQHPQEFWFPEYGGADPGYQTLLNYYLSAANRILKRTDIQVAVERSLKFVSSFCFPDGSFAGEIGHRGTGILYPGGSLAHFFQNNNLNLCATPLTDWYLKYYMLYPGAVTPTNVDAGNFVPVFNAWALLANRLHHQSITGNPGWIYQPDGVHNWPDAGLMVIRKSRAMLAFSKRNSALRRVTQSESGIWHDGSLVALTRHAQTTQGCPPYQLQQDESKLRWQYQAIQRNQPLNTMFTATILRGFGLFCMVSPVLQRVLKKILAKIVMQGNPHPHPIGVTVLVDLTQPHLPVCLHGESAKDWQPRAFGFHQHMASANTFEERAL